MIRNIFRRKARKDKKGSMLTLVLVILVMALIFIASSIMVTNSTRSRYLDTVLSGQARIAATSYAEAFCSSLQTQEITDEQLENWCGSGATATVSSASIPGMGGAADNETTVAFSKDTTLGYLYVDVTSTLGNKTNGDAVTENVRVMLKKKDPEAKTNLFNHLIEIGDNASFSEFNGVGHGAPAGSTNNTVMCHGPSDLTRNGNADFDSNIILKDRTHLGNGGTITGYVLFAGPNAGFSDEGSGNPVFNDLYFVSPNAGDPGRTFQSNGKTLDMTINSASFQNFDLNGQMRSGGSPSYYNASGMTVNGSVISSDEYKNYVNGQITANAGNGTLAAKAADMLAKAQDALNSHFPTASEASAKFLQNVPEEALNTPQSFPYTGSSDPLPSGTYHISGTIDKMYTIDASTGGYVFYIDGDTTIYGNSGAGFTIINGDNNSDAYWPRFIIGSGKTFTIGGASASNWNGIISTTHTSTGPSPIADNQHQKPHCYIYGVDCTLNIRQEHNIIDAYGGVYGDSSKIIMHGSNYFFGRLAAMDMESDNANNTEIPYCPGPTDNIDSHEMEVMTTDYEIVRFKYYY